MTSGVSKSRARAATRPLIDLLTEQLDYPVSFDFQEGGNSEDLDRFGQALTAGKIHLGVVWGNEYGFLRQRHADLRPIATCAVVGDFNNSAQLMVRRDAGVTKVSDVRGRTLMRTRRTPLTSSLYLRKLLDQHGDDYFESDAKPRATLKEALLALRNDTDNAFVALVDLNAFMRFRESHPQIASQLSVVDRSEWFPLPVMIGSPDSVNGLRANLWNRTQSELLGIHNSAEGRQLITFWRFDRFKKPDADFQKTVDQSTALFRRFLADQ